MSAKLDLTKIIKQHCKTKKETVDLIKNATGEDVEVSTVSGFINTMTIEMAEKLLSAIQNHLHPKTVKPEEQQTAPEPETKAKEVEQETMESYMPVPAGKPSGPLALGIDKTVAVMDRISIIAEQLLNKMSSNDFVIFGNNVCLNGRGTDKFIAGLPLPLEIRNVVELSIDKTPNGYNIYRYSADAVNSLTQMSIPVYSEESAEKDIYCKRKETKLKPEQVNNRDVRMAAFRGLRKEAIKMFFGLRGLDVEKARELKIDISKIKVAKR